MDLLMDLLMDLAAGQGTDMVGGRFFNRKQH